MDAIDDEQQRQNAIEMLQLLSAPPSRDEQMRQDAMEMLQLFSAPSSAMVVDEDHPNAVVHKLAAHGFNPNLVYEKVPSLNKRRSSAVNIDVDLVSRSQVGGSCYLFAGVLMIYTSYLRYILEKRLEYLQYRADHTPWSMTDEHHKQLESLVWVENITTNSHVCETTLPRYIVNVYANTLARTNAMAIQGDQWSPFSVSLTVEGGHCDQMLFSVLNACGLRVPETNFVALLLKNIPNEVHIDHVYTIRKGTNIYLDMTMPMIVNVTTYDVESRGAVLTSPFIASFYTSDKPNVYIDQGVLVDDSTVTERLIEILESVMMYVEIFKRKYNGSEITRTLFSMGVIGVRYEPNGELVPYDDAHAVLVDMDEHGDVFVFDGNVGNSYPLKMWYESFAEKYLEIYMISVAMIPVTDQSVVSVI